MGNVDVPKSADLSAETVQKIISVAENCCDHIPNLPEGLWVGIEKVDGKTLLMITTYAEYDDGPFVDSNATVITADEGWVHEPRECGGMKRWVITIGDNNNVDVESQTYPDAPFGDCAAIPSDVKPERLAAVLRTVIEAADRMEQNPMTRVDKIVTTVRRFLGVPKF